MDSQTTQCLMRQHNLSARSIAQKLGYNHCTDDQDLIIITNCIYAAIMTNYCGYSVCKIKPNKNNKYRTVFGFKRTPEFESTYAKLKEYFNELAANKLNAE